MAQDSLQAQQLACYVTFSLFVSKERKTCYCCCSSDPKKKELLCRLKYCWLSRGECSFDLYYSMAAFMTVLIGGLVM